ncbi:hypothetical protein [Teredinibacter sp. KSP-S5-2]|uniref:hypothetical protein n=1 Tax=Teredinibacter sp. KSP-S5-2 TaxID=3034506 RepID=UPI0029348897|nr:hypothetical protein [Teredinibacter sp. KSP-S5-2]WNO08742.1 hypothetical protein P5V12_17365 [Teredinibacter sp. KSP-S5-2]
MTARTIKISVLMLLVLFASACSINKLQHSKAKPLENQRSGKITVDRKATGLSGDKVGWGRFSLLAIPVVPVGIHGDESLHIMGSVRAALEAAGYNVDKTSAYSVLNAAHLRVHVTKLRFSNYTPFLPIPIPLVPTWGIAKVELRLEDRDGAAIWQQEVIGRSSNLKFWDGYNAAARGVMNNLVKNMAKAFASDEFYRASLRIKKYSDLKSETVEEKLDQPQKTEEPAVP